jgi:hypothetical protein
MIVSANVSGGVAIRSVAPVRCRQPRDPVTLVGAVGILVAAGVCAAWLASLECVAD